MTQGATAAADLRVQRTQKLVLGALLALTVQKGFSALTVSDITKHAGINRATFYRHYQDKFDLLSQYAQTVYALLDASPEASPQNSEATGANALSTGLVRVFEHIGAHAGFYRVMLGKNGDPAFTQQIRLHVQNRLRRSLPKEASKHEPLVDLYLSASSSAVVGAVLWWLEHDMPYSPAEMASISHQLGASLSGVLGQAPSGNRRRPAK